jgi:putative PIN family toxin of toxin-antitoxin system
MKVILDTNIWVSGLLFGGKPRQIFKLAKNEKLEIIVSDTLIAESEVYR